MATYRKRNGNWQAMVRTKAFQGSKTFKLKAAAVAWAESVESGKADGAQLTVGNLLEHYRDNVSINKRGRKSEELRISRILKMPIAQVTLAELSKKHVAQWREARLKEVSNLSVLREWTTLSHAVKLAMHEWEWIDHNPFTEVTKPPGSPPRDRLPVDGEIERLLHVLGYDGVTVPVTVTARVGAAVVFAIETGMRAQEICNLKPSDITGKVARVVTAKTLAGVRGVPLSGVSQQILQLLAKVDVPGDSVFHMTTAQLDALFRKAKKKALVDGLRFHDLRAEACVRLSKKLDILELARMMGHSDLSKLMIYYRKSAQEIAEKL